MMCFLLDRKPLLCAGAAWALCTPDRADYGYILLEVVFVNLEHLYIDYAQIE